MATIRARLHNRRREPEPRPILPDEIEAIREELARGPTGSNKNPREGLTRPMPR